MINIWVAGVPQSQGSTRAFVRGGRAVTTSANSKNKSWRESVHSAMQEVCSKLLEEPVAVNLIFIMPRTKSLPKTKVRPHTTSPDLDKLVRSVLDAGTGVLWRDDSVVHSIFTKKQYAKPAEQSGVFISAWTDTGHELPA